MFNQIDALNAKRMTSTQIAEAFVPTSGFEKLQNFDHVYVVGPRGSGKTTLLKMLTSEGLSAWTHRDAARTREKVQFSSVFLPADELWASQVSEVDTRSAFTLQMMIASVETMISRTTSSPSDHLHVDIARSDEGQLVKFLSELWGLGEVLGGFRSLRLKLELLLAHLPRTDMADHVLSSPDPLSLLLPALRAFNQAANESLRTWALLLDEMELAPSEVHQIVMNFVRGGSGMLALKISMSPFDRYMDFYGRDSQVIPAPGHDYQTINLAGQDSRDLRRITFGLWNASLRSRNLRFLRLQDALNDHEQSRRQPYDRDIVARMIRADEDFARWLVDRGVDLEDTRDLPYYLSSATIRKASPLLVYRDALLNFRDGKPVMRSRKKSFEPFTGSDAVVRILEGNPRWIKSAFGLMLEYFDDNLGTISRGFQMTALKEVASRFESLLRVLPNRQQLAGVSTLELVDNVTRYLRDRNLGAFSADAPNSFTVDRQSSPQFNSALMLGLYSGAIVHVRDRKSPSVLSSFANERFRITHLLSVRDGKELPLRLGKDVSLSTILAHKRRPDRQQLVFDWNQNAD